MELFFHSAPQQGLDIRSRLLQRTFRQYCAGNRQSVITRTTALADTGTPVSVLASLSAFPRSKTAPLAIFEGLINAPEAHLGRNILVCVQPLEAELAAFAARNRVDTAAFPVWWRHVLRNFEQVIVLDRQHLAQSSGFAPWVRLGLVTHFPVLLGRTGVQRDSRQILFLNHDPDAGGPEAADLQQQLSRHGEVLELTAAGLQADPDRIAAAAIHVHYGHDPHLRPAVLTPYDSLCNGIYTVVLPALVAGPLGMPDDPADDAMPPLSFVCQPVSFVRQKARSRLVREITSRSYALLADSPEAVLEFVAGTRLRLAMLAGQKLVLNPELQRYERMNEAYVAALLDSLAKQVAA